jgi:tetratricopeptide (TPR) repeat protein
LSGVRVKTWVAPIQAFKVGEGSNSDAIIRAAGWMNNLANRLSDLGRREEALKAAEEAVGLRRALAEARPDAFSAELARSLGVLGLLHAETEKPDLARATLAEAIQLVTPTFLEVPAAVAEMMVWLLRIYRAQCAAVGREADMELLGPVLAVFEKLKFPAPPHGNWCARE